MGGGPGAAPSADSPGKRPAVIRLWQDRRKSRPDELGARGGGGGPDVSPLGRELFWGLFKSCSRGLCDRGCIPEFTGTEGPNMPDGGKFIAAVSVSVDSCSQARLKYHTCQPRKGIRFVLPSQPGVTVDTGF